MAAIEALEVLVAGVFTVLIALGLAASALKLLLAHFPDGEFRTSAE